MVNFAPAGPHFLDTSAAILMMRSGVVAARDASIPFVTYAELQTGVERARNPIREDARMYKTVGASPIVYPDLDTLITYGQISAQLQRVGRSIPTNDLWIAALALQYDVPLLTDDTHFSRVSGLNVVPVR